MNKSSEKLSSLLNKEMSRKEFLGFMGMAFLGLIGVLSLLEYFRQGSYSNSNSNLSYGEGPYGGVSLK